MIDQETNNMDEDVKELVINRIESQMPANLKLSVGFDGSLSKEEIIKRIKTGDKVGKQIADAHLSFIKAQASGQLISALNSIE